MAGDPEVLFEVDAAKILAKLHLAGTQAAKPFIKDGNFIVNTGIKNDNPTADPVKPGKVEFDLTNSQGEYEVGFITTLEYSRSFDLQRTLEKYASVIAKQESGDEEILKKSSKEDQKELDDMKTSMTNAGLKINFNDKEEVDRALEDVKAQVEDDKADYEKKLSEKRSYALDALKAYFTAFVGIDRTKNLTDKALLMINISDKAKDSNDPALVKSYEIMPISQKEKELLLKKFQTDPKHCVEKVCFKVGYSLEIEK